MNRPVVLGRYRGVDVVLDTSMLLLTLLLVVSIYVDLASVPGGGDAWSAVLAVLGGVLFLGGVVLHEVSHTRLALDRGLAVARIRLYLLGGVSEIEEEAATPEDELSISIAGPVVSLLLGLGLVAVGLALPTPWHDVRRVVTVSGWAHLALAVFNALPGYPLDGGRVLRAFLWRRHGDKDRATTTALGFGRRFGLVVIGVGAFLAIRGLLVAGIWTALIGWFVNRTTVTATLRQEFIARVRGHTLADVMRPITETVPKQLTVERLVELYTVGPRLATQAVEDEGRIVGLIGERDLEATPTERRTTTTVADVMVPVGPGDVVEAATELVVLLQRDASPSRRLLVVDGDTAVGVLSSDEFGRFLRNS